MVSAKVPNWHSIGVAAALKKVRDAVPAQRRLVDRLISMPVDTAEDIQKILGLEARANKATDTSRSKGSSSRPGAEIRVATEYASGACYKTFTQASLSELQLGQNYTYHNGYGGSFPISVTQTSPEGITILYDGRALTLHARDSVSGAYFVER